VKQNIERITAGKIVTVFGVKGWVKVLSFTEPRENIFKYAPCWVKTQKGWQEIKFDQFRIQGKGLVAHIEGIDDRDEVRAYCQLDITVDKSLFPELGKDDYYWHQLIGLTVYSVQNDERRLLGSVKSMLETGANDVLVVKGNAQSIDRKERLVPYLDQFVKSIDLASGEIDVYWDPEF